MSRRGQCRTQLNVPRGFGTPADLTDCVLAVLCKDWAAFKPNGIADMVCLTFSSTASSPTPMTIRVAVGHLRPIKAVAAECLFVIDCLFGS